ncbi:unnamed protein product, partial [marine sediment metagenome]
MKLAPKYTLGPILLDEPGREFIATLKSLHNRGGPRMRIRYNGKRSGGPVGYVTRADADAARVYFDPSPEEERQRREQWRCWSVENAELRRAVAVQTRYREQAHVERADLSDRLANEISNHEQTKLQAIEEAGRREEAEADCEEMKKCRDNAEIDCAAGERGAIELRRQVAIWRGRNTTGREMLAVESLAF